MWAAGGALKKELHSDNRSQAKMPMPSGRPTMALSPGYRPPTRGTTAAAPPAAPPTAPPAFSLAGAASVAAGIIASGCINVRQKLAAVADEEVKLLASSTSALREAAAKREDEQLSRLSNTLDVLRTSAAKERSFPSLKMALMLDFDTQTPVPTGSPMPRLQGGAEGVSERWRPTESARERVAARVQERLDAAYDAAEAEAARIRLQHPPLELEAVAAQPMPWGVSPEPHYYADVAQGRSLEPPPDVAHPGAWGVSPAPHFIPDLSGVRGEAHSPVRPPQGAWPAAEAVDAEVEGAAREGAARLATLDALAREQTMLEAARAVLGSGGGAARAEEEPQRGWSAMPSTSYAPSSLRSDSLGVGQSASLTPSHDGSDRALPRRPRRPRRPRHRRLSRGTRRRARGGVGCPPHGCRRGSRPRARAAGDDLECRQHRERRARGRPSPGRHRDALRDAHRR